MKRGNLETLLLLLLAVHNVSAITELPAIPVDCKTHFDHDAPQDRTDAPTGIAALASNYDIKPVAFFDGSEIARSL